MLAGEVDASSHCLLHTNVFPSLSLTFPRILGLHGEFEDHQSSPTPWVTHRETRTERMEGTCLWFDS